MALQPAGALTDYVSVPDRANIRIQRPFSGSMWIKRNATSENDLLLSKRESGGFGLEVLPTTNLLSLVYFTVAQYDSTTGISGGTGWQHVGFTINATTTLKFYNNGAQLGSNVTAGVPAAEGSPQPLVLGVKQNTSGGGIFSSSDIEIAEAALWAAELDAAEMAALGKGFAPSLIRPQSRTLYLPLVREPRELHGGSASLSGTVNVTPHPRVFYPKRRQLFSVAAGGATTTSGAFSAAGAATATFAGSTANQFAEAAISMGGSGTASLRGASIASAAAATEGEAVARFIGAGGLETNDDVSRIWGAKVRDRKRRLTQEEKEEIAAIKAVLEIVYGRAPR